MRVKLRQRTGAIKARQAEGERFPCPRSRRRGGHAIGSRCGMPIGCKREAPGCLRNLLSFGAAAADAAAGCRAVSFFLVPILITRYTRRSLCPLSVNLLTDGIITVTARFGLLKFLFTMTCAVFRLVCDWFKGLNFICTHNDRGTLLLLIPAIKTHLKRVTNCCMFPLIYTYLRYISDARLIKQQLLDLAPPPTPSSLAAREQQKKSILKSSLVKTNV